MNENITHDEKLLFFNLTCLNQLLWSKKVVALKQINFFYLHFFEQL